MFEDEKSITARPDRPLRLWIEPWGDRREFPPGTIVRVRATSPQEGRIEVQEASDATWVFGWVGSTLEILVSGERVALFDLPPPSLPVGMSMRGFIGGVLGSKPGIDAEGEGVGAAQPPTSAAPKTAKRTWWRFWRQ